MKEIYENLLNQIHRLKGEISEEELKDIFTEFIYDKLTDEEVLEIIKTDKVSSIDLPDGLKKEAVLRLTLKTIQDLESSQTWSEFQEKNKQPPRPSIEFDNLIQHLLKQKPSN